MPSILGFPNEILYRIIDRIHPDDIVNFSLAHKHFGSLSKEAVSLHEQRKKKYESILLHGCYLHKPNEHPFRLIKDICMDWKIGEYPKYLTFECCCDKRKVSEVEEHDPIVQTIMQDFQGDIEDKAAKLGVPKTIGLEMGGLRRDVGPILNSFCVDASFRATREGDRESMLALLLLFIPNLQQICFQESAFTAALISDAIYWMSERIRQQSSSARKPLMDLSHVSFLGYNDHALYTEFEWLMPFATLPSMRAIFGEFVQGIDQATDKWVLPPHSSNVIYINLQCSVIKAQYLSELLVGVKALHHFTYHREDDEGSAYALQWNCPMETHQIIGTLLEHAKHSLEYLALTGRCHPRNGGNDIHPCKGSLRGFQNLKVVVIDSNIYVEEASYSGPPLSPHEISYVGKNNQMCRRLVDLLPPSIETILLIGPDILDHIFGLLDKFFEQKQQRLPKLRKLLIGKSNYHPGADWVVAFSAQCRKVGVELKVETESGMRKDGTYRID